MTRRQAHDALPSYRYRAPKTVQDARMAGGRHPTMLLGGGTDLIPNMKRRQQVPSTVIGLRGIAELSRVDERDGLEIGAGVTLTSLVHDARIKNGYLGLWQAVGQIATPLLRNMGTIGGNVCLDTRCTYYDQSFEWRQSINFCMKKDGDTCWVATSSDRCLAVSSTDTAPALMALRRDRAPGVGGRHPRRRAHRSLRNDGMHLTSRRRSPHDRSPADRRLAQHLLESAPPRFF
jgi:4-hydroxybenzoyl-CoA reductase subunit beta